MDKAYPGQPVWILDVIMDKGLQYGKTIMGPEKLITNQHLIDYYP